MSRRSAREVLVRKKYRRSDSCEFMGVVVLYAEPLLCVRVWVTQIERKSLVSDVASAARPEVVSQLSRGEYV